MKSLKKTLVLLVVFSMILSTLVPAFAATDVLGLDCEEEVARMEALGIIAGFEDGTFRPSETITRAQMAVIICKMVGIEEATVAGNANVASKFSDVPAGEWYSGYVNVAAGRGLISGFPDGTFRPSETLTMNQVLTLAVNALGRGEYVSTMGTWPANYIAEAAKLGLMDGVKTSDANRGNVAIICWNTLETPMWDVTSTEYQGSINLGAQRDVTLLSVYFRDFVYVDEYTDKPYFKEAEAVDVDNVPAKDKTLGDRQIVLDADDIEYEIFAAFEEKPRKNSDKATYVSEDGAKIYAYIPEEVCEDIDSLLGRKVTVLFGKDNVVALITVDDDTINGEFVDKYDADKDEITIAGKRYDFAKRAKIFVNNEDTDMAEVLSVLGEKSKESFKKKVEADIVLDEDGDIERLDLYVSGTYTTFNTIEGVVTKNSSDTITYYYYTGSRWDKATYDYEDELEDDELPRVTIDGKAGSIEDIEAGNVITMIYNAGDKEDVLSILVATEAVSGEVTRTKQDGAKISVDGTEYTSSMGVVLATDDEIKDAGKETATLGDTIAKNDTVELFVNIYGEYVIVRTEDAGAGEWEFAYVRSIKEVDENDSDELVATLRLLLADGTKTSAYSIVVDIDDYEPTLIGDDTKIDAFDALVDDYVGEVIAFKANADNEIVLDSEDADDIKEDLVKVVAENDFDDYEVELFTDLADVDDDRETIGDYDFNSDTIIFVTPEEKIYTKWNSIIDSDELVANATLVLDSNDIKYMIFNTRIDATSDELFAVYEDVDSDEIELFDGEDQVFEHTGSALESAANKISENAFVEYALNSSEEVKAIASLIDVDAFRDEDAVASVLSSSAKTTLVKAPVYIDIKVEATTNADLYKGYKDPTDDTLLFETGKAATLAVEYIENVFTKEGIVYTVIQENAALDAAYDGMSGRKEATYSIDESADVTVAKGEGLAVLLKDNTPATVKVYEGTGSSKVLVTVYTFSDVDVATDAEVTTLAKATSEVESIFAKDLFAVESTGTLKFAYVDDMEDEYGVKTLGTVKVDEDTVVYDLREDGFAILDFDEFKAIADAETVYVVAFVNGSKDANADANMLVIVE